VRIAENLIGVVGHDSLDRDAPRLGVELMARDHMIEDAADREEADVERDAALLQPGEIEQILDDAIEPQRFALDRGEIALTRGGVA
jgi:hypothetical protein